LLFRRELARRESRAGEQMASYPEKRTEHWQKFTAGIESRPARWKKEH